MEAGILIAALGSLIYGIISLLVKIIYNGVLLLLKILVITHKEYKRTYTRTIRRKGNSTEIIDRESVREV